jgi:hypothetical protein
MAQPTTGESKNGRSEFSDQGKFKGRKYLVRFSDDGGKTWEVNWITIDIRMKDESEETH